MPIEQLESGVPRPRAEVKRVARSVTADPSTWEIVDAATKKFKQANPSQMAEQLMLVGWRALNRDPSLLFEVDAVSPVTEEEKP
jgi:hypothetical protein